MSSLPGKDKLALVANTIRFLSAECVEKAKSGHPGMPMGMAELGAMVWLKYLKHNPTNPKWLARDRFVLSNGHGSMFLYSLLHLSGYDLSLEDLKQFRQWGSKTPGHPESHMTVGVETTTGPLGQGVANAVGLALGQKMLEAHYATDSSNPFAHKVFCFCGDGCLMEGVSGEASSIAGHLGLGNLIMIYDDNGISIAGHTTLSFTEDVQKRYEGFGWHTVRCDGHDFESIDRALDEAVKETSRPTIILAKTIIGKGSPNKCDTHDVHGAPLGAEEMAATKKALNWPLDKEFYIPDEVREIFAGRLSAMQDENASWDASFASWQKANPDAAQKLETQLSRTVPADLDAKLLAAVPTDGKPLATRKLGELVLQVASATVPSLIGGSADLDPSTLTYIKDGGDVQKNSFKGKNLRFGVREHGMGAIMNGLSYYGGYIPYGATFFCFLDYMRPTVRLAALCHLQGIFIYTHDSIFLGEDGPTHQPIEHLAILRATPNMRTYRPADGVETAMCYAMALERKDGPAAMILTRQNLDPIERTNGITAQDVRKGAYTAYESKPGTNPDIVFVATGSEVGLATKTAKLITSAAVRVVSMPCFEAYKAQPDSYKTKLIPTSAKKVVVEAATPFGWDGALEANKNMLVIGIDHYGASAPANILAEKFGLTPESIRAKIKEQFQI